MFCQEIGGGTTFVGSNYGSTFLHHKLCSFQRTPHPSLEVSMPNWLEVAISSKWELEAVLSHPLEVNGIGRHDTVLIILTPNNTTGNHQYDAGVTKTRQEHSVKRCR